MNIDAKAPHWRDTTWIKRFNECRSMLAMHGLLSEAESHRVHGRLLKLAAKCREEVRAAKGKPKIGSQS